MFFLGFWGMEIGLGFWGTGMFKYLLRNDVGKLLVSLRDYFIKITLEEVVGLTR
jgi:hypothetical protein